MDAPLGCAVGNALEVDRVPRRAEGRRPRRSRRRVSMELAARMLVLGQRRRRPSPTPIAECARRIASGAGLDRFRQIIEQQGGDPRVVDDYSRMPAAPERHVVAATSDGFLSGLDAELVGRASVALGAGRDRVEDTVDPAVGIMVRAKPGAVVRAGDADSRAALPRSRSTRARPRADRASHSHRRDVSDCHAAHRGRGGLMPGVIQPSVWRRRDPGDRVRLLDQPARDQLDDGRVGIEPADRLRDPRAEDIARAARLRDARRRHQQAARLRRRRRRLRLRPARRQQRLVAAR